MSEVVEFDIVGEDSNKNLSTPKNDIEKSFSENQSLPLEPEIILNENNSSKSTRNPTTGHQSELSSCEKLHSATTIRNGLQFDSQLSPHTLRMAATLLNDARSNRFLNFKSDEASLRLYRLYYNPILKWFQHLAILMLLGLAMLEEPSMWPDRIPFWGCCIIEVACLAYLGFRIIHLASFQHKIEFWKDKKNIVAIVLLSLSVIDLVAFSIWRGFEEETHSYAVRWSRPLRPLIMINFPQARQVRRAFRNIRRTLIEIIFVLTLFLFSVMLFALLALRLFSKRNLTDRFGDPYFRDYLNSLWNLYVLVTTANNPDVMMPAYDSSNWYALFFIFFLVINLYMFMNVLLAVIFNSYKKHLKNEVKAAVFSKRRKLAQAYELVKEHDGSRYCLTLSTWSQLMKVLSPQTSEQQVKMYFQVMDGDGDGKLNKAEFLTAADLLNIPLTEVKDRMILWDRLCPTIFNHAASKALRRVVLNKWFRYFFDFSIVVNAVFIAIDLQEAEWFFLALFTIEILLKFYVYGPKRFAAQFWNLFDVVVIGGAMIVTIVEATKNEQDSQGDTLDFILILRVLRLVKIVNGIERFRIIVQTLVNIGPSTLIYGGVLFVCIQNYLQSFYFIHGLLYISEIFYYAFAIVGMEVFQGKITYYGNNTYNLTALKPSQHYCGNIKLKDSEFFTDRYCSNNFNDIAKAMVVLVELTVVNQWHVITSGFVLVTHPAARIYFLFFHFSVVVLIMNIVIAFILEAFILEYSLAKSKFESSFEAKILQLGYALGQKKLEKPGAAAKAKDKEAIIDDMDDIYVEEGTRFHIKQNRTKVEVLLQRMFEDELDPEDLGSEDSFMEDERPARKLTLNEVVY